MDIRDAADIVSNLRARGRRSPLGVLDDLTEAEAYAVQDEVAHRLMAAGRTHTGWKIAGNSDRFRRTFNGAAPMRGYLFGDDLYPSGTTLNWDDLTVRPRLESELCFLMGERLAGPAPSRAEVKAAIAAVAPAFELPCLIRSAESGDLVAGGKMNLSMCIADNCNNLGYVLGEWTDLPVGELAEIRVEERRNGSPNHSGAVCENVDDLLESVSWLATNLHQYGVAIEAGQHVLAGNCTPAAWVVEKGDRWETSFSEIGTVTVLFD